MKSISTLLVSILFTVSCSTVASSIPPYPIQIRSSSSKFSAKSASNIAVYFGRTDETANTNLSDQCNDTNIDIVILAFTTSILSGSGGYPNISFASLCDGYTSTMLSKGAVGLRQCTNLATEIKACQKAGKKIFVGVGGNSGNVTFASEDEATQSAVMLWDVFGGGNGVGSGLRPFGDDVYVDGFDLDNETGESSYWVNFTSSLRNQFSNQKKRDYYLSGAPSCYYPSASMPLSVLTQLDFVWPQFYAAPSCNIGTSNFTQSFNDWSARLAGGPKLYIGAVAWEAGSTNGGYQDPDSFATTIAQMRTTVNSTVFGGVMLWDAAYAHITTNEAGEDFANVTKKALQK
ncbi:chitin recognition protein [Phlyctema vagabunda]|uniref:chitinase n=1 Tax=Phlyctema vagabunda TaxID=108571 RepID=A0ABR4PE28_9HELO